MLTSSERCWQSCLGVSVFTRMCMGSDSQSSRITNRWRWFTWRIWLLPPSVYRGCCFASNRMTSSSNTSQARRWRWPTQCHDNPAATQRAWNLTFRSVTCNSRLESWTSYGERRETTTSCRASWRWSLTAGPIVSETYIRNCERSGPFAMNLWRMTALSWKAIRS